MNRHRHAAWKPVFAVAAALVCAALSGCVTAVPDIRGHGETQTTEIAREGNLVVHIKCELTRAVFRVEDDEDSVEDYRQAEIAAGRKPPPAPMSAAWLNDWGSKVSLKIQVEETTSFAPSLAITENFSNHISNFSNGAVTFGRSFSLPLSINGSAKATRTETMSFYFTFADLKTAAEDQWKAEVGLSGGVYDKTTRRQKRAEFLSRACPASNGVLLEGDLKIEDFIRTKVMTGSVPGVIIRADGAPPFDAFGYEISFVITRGAGASPSWKLYPLSVNPAGSLLAGSRVKTDSMILTLGKVENAKASAEAAAVHQAALTGQAVADALHQTGP